MNLIVPPGKEGTALPRILRAALRLFVKKGIDGTTIKDLARAAGVSEGALYRHFRGKDELASHLFTANRERVTVEVQRRVDIARGARAKLKAYTAAIFEQFESDQDLFYFLLIAEHRELRQAEDGDHPGLLLERVLAEGQAAGEIRPGELPLMGALWLGTLHRLCMLRRYGALEHSLAERLDQTQELLWTAVQAPEGRENAR